MLVERGAWLERLHHRWVDDPLPLGTTQAFLEWSLAEALKALNKRPLKPLQRIDS